MMTPFTKPALVCIFAENIRNEASGQCTIIGTYLGRAIQFPTVGDLTLQNFAVQCILEVPLDLQLESINCELMLGETTLQTVSLPAEAIAAFTKDRAAQIARDPQLRAFMITIALQLGNFVVPQPGFFRVRVQVGQETIWSNALEFAAAPAANPGDPTD